MAEVDETQQLFMGYLMKPSVSYVCDAGKSSNPFNLKRVSQELAEFFRIPENSFLTIVDVKKYVISYCIDKDLYYEEYDDVFINAKIETISGKRANERHPLYIVLNYICSNHLT